jgi:hypothetical protein
VARTEDDDIELQDALQASQRVKEIKELESASTPAMIQDDQYLSDERSGEEVTDSEQEFQEIVELDNIIKDILERSLEVSELHVKAQDLFSKMRALKDLIDFESQDLRDIVEGIIAKELTYFTSFSNVVKLVETAY